MQRAIDTYHASIQLSRGAAGPLSDGKQPNVRVDVCETSHGDRFRTERDNEWDADEGSHLNAD